MYLRIAGPFPERLSIEPEQDPSRAPESGQTHVHHDGWDVSRSLNPRSNELRESIAPEILVDGDGDEQRASNRFVGIYSIC